MIQKDGPLVKKITTVTALIVAVSGLIAAWTAFVKVHNPPPPKEVKAEQAYEILKERIEFQDIIIRDMREEQREMELKMWLMHQSTYAARPTMMDPADVEGILEAESLDLSTPEEPPPPVQQKAMDSLLDHAKPLPKKL